MTLLLNHFLLNLQNSIELLLYQHLLLLFLLQFYAVLPAMFEHSTDQFLMLLILLFFHKSILPYFLSNYDMYLCLVLYVHFLESFVPFQEPSTLYDPRSFQVQFLLITA